MKKETRAKFNEFLGRVQELNMTDDASKKFSVEPSVQQTLEAKMQESSAFLQSINIIGVDEQEGEALGLGVSSPIAGTTNTTAQARQTRDASSIDGHKYRCEQTNFDSHITYAKLDAWAKFKNFQILLRDAILKRQALDRIMIGFNGTSRAATSDPVANPLLQDVNKGWLQHYRAEAPERVLDEVVPASGKVVVGPTGDYKNLDALVFDAVNNMIEPWYQDDPELVVICGRALLADKYFPIINATQAPSERLAADMIISQKRIGNHRAAQVPFFPANALMITRLDNLSLYWQNSARRRTITENASRDRVENWESSNDAYVVEDFGAGCLVENIEIQAA